MRNIRYIFGRELAGYFATPVAYVFLVIFLATAGAFTFYLGNFFDRGQADLQSFFAFHPWLYLILIPAIGMRLWAEERKTGTIELFLTLPISITEAVLGKFLAAWAFTGIALILTSYSGSFLMAGGYLAIAACISAATKSQVIAFVVSAAICFIFTVSGSEIVLNFFSGWAPTTIVNAVASFSFIAHFNAISRGVLDLRDF